MDYSDAGVKYLFVNKVLSTTSYAVLGLLSLRSWTGYELTQQARRSLAHAWPKEDSVLYEEPRRLAAMGLAEAQKEQGRGRGRNRYSITDAGRQALRAWLATPGAPPHLELEPLLRPALEQRAVARIRKNVALKAIGYSRPVVQFQVTIDDLMMLPGDELQMVCEDLLKSDDLDPNDVHPYRIVPEAVLNFCRDKKINNYK